MNFYDKNSTYELLENYEDEMADILYLKELYPTSCMIIQETVDEICVIILYQLFVEMTILLIYWVKYKILLKSS